MDQRNSTVDGLAHARQAFAKALASRDAPFAASIYAEDARLLPPLVDLVEGRDEIQAFWQAGVDSGIAGVDLEPLDCTELGSVAYELGRYSISMGADAARIVERGRYMTVHRLIDGRWQRAAEMFTSDSQPGGNQS